MTSTTLVCPLRGTRRGAALAAALLCTLLTARASAQDAEAAERGEAKYTHTCAPCHGRGLGDDGREALPGTAALEIKYRGAVPAVLEDRPGLSYEVLQPFVRNGSWSMPPFRPTELTDDEIRDIAAYLAVSSQDASERASSAASRP
jgi:mono/diheme cytochrome c family protein